MKYDVILNALRQNDINTVNENHFFADNTARDSYFIAHSTEKVSGQTFIKVGTAFQLWNGTIWQDASGVFKGEKGDKGDTGLQGLQGIQGEKGEKGDTGDTGDANDVNTYSNEALTRVKVNATSSFIYDTNGNPTTITETNIGTAMRQKITNITYNSDNAPTVIEIRIKDSSNIFLYGVRKTLTYSGVNLLGISHEVLES